MIHAAEIADGSRFAFGQNWKIFLDSLDEERIQQAEKSLQEMLDMSSFEGKTFLDVGSGSGLFSLAAKKLSAQVHSFDFDPQSVGCTLELKRRYFPDDPTWVVEEGSVLDNDYLATLGQFDIVYAWGVLHHTGSMWEAVANAARLMKEDGIFYVTLYTTTRRSPYWIRKKQEYNRARALGKRWMELTYLLRHRLLNDLVARRNTLRIIREYKKKRGMEFMTDMRDWLGGWPYEDASISEVVEFTHDRLDLELVRIVTGKANTEYLLRRRGAS